MDDPILVICFVSFLVCFIAFINYARNHDRDGRSLPDCDSCKLHDEDFRNCSKCYNAFESGIDFVDNKQWRKVVMRQANER